jgi:tetrahydromethanopterin S-methyltransferase subunit A
VVFNHETTKHIEAIGPQKTKIQAQANKKITKDEGDISETEFVNQNEKDRLETKEDSASTASVPNSNKIAEIFTERLKKYKANQMPHMSLND